MKLHEVFAILDEMKDRDVGECALSRAFSDRAPGPDYGYEFPGWDFPDSLTLIINIPRNLADCQKKFDRTQFSREFVSEAVRDVFGPHDDVIAVYSEQVESFVSG